MSTRRAIIRSAQALLVERGYAGTTIAALKRHAGVGSGTLYHHFPRGGRRIDAAKVAVGTVDPEPLEQIVGLALAQLSQGRVERLVEALYDEEPHDNEPCNNEPCNNEPCNNEPCNNEPCNNEPCDEWTSQAALLARLVVELDSGCPLVRLCSDLALLDHARYRRTLSDAVDVLVDALARHPLNVERGAATDAATGAAKEDAMDGAAVAGVTLVAFALGFVTLDRLYRREPQDGDDDPRSQAEQDADIDALLRPGGYGALQRRRRTMSALDALRDRVRLRSAR